MTTPVSGPGQFSQRTDKAVSEANRQLPNADYGEQAQYQEQLQAAPIASSGDIGSAFSSLFGNPASRVIGLGEPTQMPTTPVTDGAAVGPGAGLEALPGAAPDPKLEQMRAWIPTLMYMASQPNSSDASRNLLRAVKANLGM